MVMMNYMLSMCLINDPVLAFPVKTFTKKNKQGK